MEARAVRPRLSQAIFDPLRPAPVLGTIIAGPLSIKSAVRRSAVSPSVHPVDEVLPLPRLFALGLQHVLVMYANAVAVPLIVGGALHLPKDQLALLINADLFACGIATLIQTIGFGPFRDPAADHHGGHRGVDLADAGDGGDAGGRADRHLRRGADRRHLRPVRRPVRRARAALLSRRGHRLDHHHDRRVADAGRHRLGRGWRGRGRFRRRRLSRGRGRRADGDPAGDQVRPRLRRAHVGADRHRRRLRVNHRTRLDGFRRPAERGMAADRAAAAVRPARRSISCRS